MDKNKKKWAKKHKKGSVHQAVKKDSSRMAISRYLERVKKIDMDDLKDEIVPESVKKQILFFKKGKFPAKGYKLIVDKKKVITIYEA